MKITPLDIQQMVFKVSFRGYDKEEVNRFLEELAQTIESLNRDNAVQREKIVFLEQQLAELKRTEATLSSTLLSAQSLADDVKRNAQREADLVIKEAELKARRVDPSGRGRADRYAARPLVAPETADCSWLNDCAHRCGCSSVCWKWKSRKRSMTPRPHRRRSSKESRARRYDLLEVAAAYSLSVSWFVSRASSTAASFPTSDRCLAYGYPSRHSGGAAIGR